MSKWIFQDIKDIQAKHLPKIVLTESNAEFERLREQYYAALRKKVTPEIYVRYELWTCDIYVDVDYIIVQTLAIYKKQVTRKQVMEWIEQNKEPHHYLT
jgi:hypothetical protein